jgi:hypothetical protein
MCRHICGHRVFVVSDRCAECFELLKPAPLGGRYACEAHPLGGYWSPAVPEGSGKDKARLVSKHGKPTLYYYGMVRR